VPIVVSKSRVILTLGVVLVSALVVGEIAYGVAYGTLAWWQEPARISWCGRTYLPSTGPLLTRADVEQQRASLPGAQPYPVVQVTKVPLLVGGPVLASVTPAATRERLRVPCAMVVYLETGPDTFRAYALSGGP
jgi:hypothetical protein